MDVYSEWCGPCTAMATYLKEIKLLLGDDFLHCALVSSSFITRLRAAETYYLLRQKRITLANWPSLEAAANQLGYFWR